MSNIFTVHKKTKHQTERLRAVIKKNCYKKMIFDEKKASVFNKKKEAESSSDEEEEQSDNDQVV